MSQDIIQVSGPTSTNRWMKTLCYALCVMLLPFALMSYLYRQNIDYLSLSQVAIFSALFALGLLIFFGAIRLITRSDLAAFLFSALMFIGLVRYRALSALLEQVGEHITLPLGACAALLKIALLVGTTFLVCASFAQTKPFRRLERKIEDRFSLSPLLLGSLLGACIYPILYHAYNALLTFIAPDMVGLLLINTIMFVALVVATICMRCGRVLSHATIPQFLLVFIGVLFLLNAIPLGLALWGQTSDNTAFKTSFAAERFRESQPNIYWFHMDGMLGFDSFETYFGDDQKDFKEDLTDRGFMIFPHAALEANHSSQNAIPALMNPYFYDRVLSWKFDPEYAASLGSNSDLVDDPSLRITPNYIANRTAMERNELVLAFNQVQANTNTIASLDIYFYPTVRQFYNTLDLETPLLEPLSDLTEASSFVSNIGALQNLAHLLSDIGPIPYPASAEGRELFRGLLSREFAASAIDRNVDVFSHLSVDDYSALNLNDWNFKADCLVDTLDRPAPRFTLISFPLAHGPFYYDEQGYFTIEGSDDPMRYRPHHRFATATLIDFIDLILEADPDAVIVLQADHGLHLLSEEEIAAAFGEGEAVQKGLWNQVMSAVRIPAEHQTEANFEILSDPRNISRYLINTYIGQNYDYIPSQFKQSF